MDTYCEYILKKKKNTRDYIISVLTVFLALILMHLLTTVIILALNFITFLLPFIWFGIIWGAIRIITGRNLEYDYLLVGGDLDVDKVINKSRRARVISVRRREIEIMAPEGSDKLDPAWKDLPKVDVTSGYNPEAVYVLIINSGERKAVMFEPTEKMKEQLRLKLPGKVFFE